MERAWACLCVCQYYLFSKWSREEENKLNRKLGQVKRYLLLCSTTIISFQGIENVFQFSAMMDHRGPREIFLRDTVIKIGLVLVGGGA